MRHERDITQVSSRLRYLAGSRVRNTMATRVSSRTHIIASRAHSSIPWRLADEIAATTGAAMTAAIPVTDVWCSTTVDDAGTADDAAAVDDAGTSAGMVCPVVSE
jgi:type IV secretory pathway ATPase VirB11/archaellum biosynthesis ATPase